MSYSKVFKTGHDLVPTLTIYTIEGKPEDYELETEIPRVLEEAFDEGWSVDVVEDIDTNHDPRNLTGPPPSYTFDYYITVTSPDDDKYSFRISLVGKDIELTTDEDDEEIIGYLEEGITALIEEIDEFEKSGASMEEVYATAEAKAGANGASKGGRRRRQRKTRKAKAGRKTRKGKGGRKHAKKTHKRRGGSRRVRR